MYAHTQPGSQTHRRGERGREGGRDTPAAEKQVQSLSPHVFIIFQQKETLPPAAETFPPGQKKKKAAEGKILPFPSLPPAPPSSSAPLGPPGPCSSSLAWFRGRARDSGGDRERGRVPSRGEAGPLALVAVLTMGAEVCPQPPGLSPRTLWW